MHATTSVIFTLGHQCCLHLTPTTESTEARVSFVTNNDNDKLEGN